MQIVRNALLTASAAGHHLDIVDSGYAEVSTDWNLQQVTSPYSRLYVLYGGEARILFGNREMPLRAGHAYLIPAQFLFDYACDAYMAQLYFHVNLYAPDGRDLLTRLRSPLEQPVALPVLQRLRHAYDGHQLRDMLNLRQDLHALLAGFLSDTELGRQPIDTPSPLLQRVYDVTRQHLNAQTTIPQLAESLSMSASTLAKRFKEETGTTLGRYLDSLLLQQAQKLLLSTDESICRIAELLGFCDQFYFSRYFKLHKQETPSRYRQRLRNRL